jgi:hypothetical protein
LPISAKRTTDVLRSDQQMPTGLTGIPTRRSARLGLDGVVTVGDVL